MNGGYQRPLRGVGLPELPSRMMDAMKGAASALPPGTGIIVFAFDFGDKGAIAYIANGQRDDCIVALEEWIRKQRAGMN